MWINIKNIRLNTNSIISYGQSIDCDKTLLIMLLKPFNPVEIEFDSVENLEKMLTSLDETLDTKELKI